MGVNPSKCCSGEDGVKQDEFASGVPNEREPGVVDSREEEAKKDPYVPEVVVLNDNKATAGGQQEEPEIVAPEGQQEEFHVIIEKTDGSKLGIDVDMTDQTTLFIDLVNDGLVSDWNKANPTKAICKGDRVLEVNGITGNAQELTEACKREKKLNLLVRRG